MKTISAQERNEKVLSLLEDLFLQASNSDGNFQKPFKKDEVEALFSSHIWGHREITLTIIIARLLDKNFHASQDFYACNPRSLFEKPIRTKLRELGIPHKKSGPLNVAKNIQKINADWAENKRGDGIAMSVAKIVEKIEQVSEKKLRAFAVVYCKRYLQEAEKVEQLKFIPQQNQDPLFLTKLAYDLVSNVPDGGSTPQMVIGILLEVSHENKNSSVVLSGHKDSVSTTNTTSKKAGDAIEQFPDKTEFIYEITVKKFSNDRLRESYEAIKAHDTKNAIQEVFVICRQQDIPDEAINQFDSKFFLGTVSHQDIIYYFVDIFEWMQEKILFLTPSGREQYYQNLAKYINQPNTSEKVKVYFKQWHTKHQPK